MALKDHLLAHSQQYPAAQVEDYVKFLYQRTFGAEHLLLDPSAGEKFLQKEWEHVTPDPQMPLTDPLSPKVARLHLAPAKAFLPLSTVLALFLLASSDALPQGCATDQMAKFRHSLALLETLSESDQLPLEIGQVRQFLAEYTAAGCPALHHSPRFRETYRPAYRLIPGDCVALLPLLKEISRQHSAGKPILLAIDGCAAAGKSTAAKRLAQIYGASVIHMDDFFLPPALRTPERLSQPGGNVDYARFMQEVLPHLKAGRTFSYRPFSCKTMALQEPVEVPKTDLTIVEGAYSCHPNFGQPYTLRAFFSISPEEQRRRILDRNGEALWPAFRDRWIPMEQAYFSAYNIPETCQIRYVAEQPC